MSGLRRNAAASVAGRFGTAAIWILATPYVLTVLGPERFGVWSLFLAFNGYLLAFDLGVGNTMIRFLAALRPAGGRHVLRRTLGRGLGAAFALGLLWAVAVQVAKPWIVTAFHVPPGMIPEVMDALTIFGVGILLLFPVQAMTASLYGFERVDLSNLCTFLGVVAHVAVLCASLAFGGGLRGVAWAGLAGHVVAGSLAAAFLARELARAPGHGDAPGPTWREMLHFGAALQVLWILIMLQIQSGRFMVGLLGDLAKVTEYELAFRVAVAIAGLPILIRDPVIPAVTRTLESEGRAAVTPLYESTSRWLYFNSALALGLLWLLADDITAMWLGAGHGSVPGLIRWWVVAYAAYLAYAPGVAIARGMGRPAYEIASYAAALATNLGLCALWIPRHGAAGAVTAAAVSYVAGLVVFAGGFHRRRVFAPFWSEFARPLFARAVAGALATGVSVAILSAPPVVARVPGPGWGHAAVSVILFLVLFGLAFHPLGDTRRLLDMLTRLARDAFPQPRVPST